MTVMIQTPIDEQPASKPKRSRLRWLSLVMTLPLLWLIALALSIGLYARASDPGPAAGSRFSEEEMKEIRVEE